MSRNKRAILLTAVGVMFLMACGPISIPFGPLAVNPKPGAKLAGTIEMGEKAKSGEIIFAVTEDGGAITSLIVTLNDVTCDGLTAGMYSDFLGTIRVPVTNGRFTGSLPAMGGQIKNFMIPSLKPWPTVASLSKAGAIEGSFSSPTEASGTITIYLGIPGSKLACPLGTFRWSARGN
jgi:hypothetical protein